MDNKHRARQRRLERFFNLTVELWDLIEAFQNKVCFVCSKPQKSGKRLATDHSHRTGLVRGLLCSTCNRILGKIERTWDKDTNIVNMLLRLASYMKEPPAVTALGVPIYTFAGRFGTKRHKEHLNDIKLNKECINVVLVGKRKNKKK